MKPKPSPNTSPLNRRCSAALLTVLAAGLMAAGSAHGAASVSIETQTHSSGTAYGWMASADWLANPAPTVDLNQAGIIDWVLPNTDTSALTSTGRLMVVGPQKAGADIILLEDFGPATFSGLNGPHQATMADTDNVFFAYTDGDMGDSTSPAGGYYGNRWFADRDGAAYMVWTVDLTEEPRTIWYFWNHNFRNLTALSATVKDISGTALTAESAFQYETMADPIVGEAFTSVITAAGENAGDYLEIVITGNNPTFRGIAVLEQVTVDYGPFNPYLDTLVNGFVDTGDWMGYVYVSRYPWVWSASLGKYLYAAGDGWFYIVR